MTSNKVGAVTCSEKIITVKCIDCGIDFTMRVEQSDYDAWRKGEKLIQDAFPYLSVSERELLLSKLCGVCFDNLFAYLDEEED